MAVVSKFEIEVDSDALVALRERLRHTRFAVDRGNDDGAWGLPTRLLADLVEYWSDGFDWAHVVDTMNRFAHFRTVIDDIPIHFVHARGEIDAATPIVLSHGWPGSFWDFRDVIPRLTHPSRYGGDPADACHVVAPSLPGYDFSAPLPRDVEYLETAQLWVQLMARLGYPTFAAHGYDWGGSITAQLGHRFGDRVSAVHLASPLTLGTWSLPRPHAAILGSVIERGDPTQVAALLDWERPRASHLTVHLLEPQTLAHALADSPAGLLAWLAQRRLQLSDADLDGNVARRPDDLLTLATLTWLTDTAGSAMRYYRAATQTAWLPVHDRQPVVEPPAGLSIFTRDVPPGFDPSVLASYYDTVFVHRHGSGKHFPSVEMPEVLSADILATIRHARQRSNGGPGGHGSGR